jgi:hypothetical protein
MRSLIGVRHAMSRMRRVVQSMKNSLLQKILC